MIGTRDYQDWHRGYDDPNSALSWRLNWVSRYLHGALDELAGDRRLLSVCAGDGRDVLGVLGERSDAHRVSAVLLELHPDLAQRAHDEAAESALPHVEVRAVDASNVEAYEQAVPADIVLLVGIFGNIADADVWRMINFAPQLCRPGAAVIWSRGRKFSRELPGVTAGDINDEVRARFVAAGFEEHAYETYEGGGRPALGVMRYVGPVVDLQPEPSAIFTFLR